MESDIMLRLSYKPGLSKWTQRLLFCKNPLKKSNKRQQKPTPLLFFRKIYYEIKSKTSSTLVQLTVNFFQSNKTNSNKI